MWQYNFDIFPTVSNFGSLSPVSYWLNTLCDMFNSFAASACVNLFSSLAFFILAGNTSVYILLPPFLIIIALLQFAISLFVIFVYCKL